MTPTQPTFPWRGYVNQITYGADLRAPVGDDLVERLATELIRRRYFTGRAEDYYAAAAAALASGERLAFTDDQDEAATRDLLARLVPALDRRRPWPEPAFVEQGIDRWDELRNAPVVAWVPLPYHDVEGLLNRGFYAVGQVMVLVLRLRTGQTVALRSGPGGLDLLTFADGGPAVAAFRELTGLETRTR